jgi:hypothetical protein
MMSVTTATYAVVAARKVSHREVTATIIAEFYSSLRELTQIQLDEWRLAHLFEVAENYEAAVQSLRDVAPPDAVTTTELRIKERAAALTIFGLYEHVVYQLNEAGRAGDKLRKAFLVDAADYFTSRLLQNPRLLYLWSLNGGNLECEFEIETREHHRTHIRPDPEKWDRTGPYEQGHVRGAYHQREEAQSGTAGPAQNP